MITLNHSLGEAPSYREIDSWRTDLELVTAVDRCIDIQRAAASRTPFSPDPNGPRAVSESALQEILRCGRSVHGISSDRAISDVLVFNAPHIPGAVLDRRLAAARQSLDRLVARKLTSFFGTRLIVVANSGQFTYPPGGHMSWHTNSEAPGWRLYITRADEPGRSFFRYREPGTGHVVTSYDREFDIRLFCIDPGMPIWHAVYSDTYRFSFGFVIKPWTVRNYLSHKRHVAGRWLAVRRRRQHASVEAGNALDGNGTS